MDKINYVPLAQKQWHKFSAASDFRRAIEELRAEIARKNRRRATIRMWIETVVLIAALVVVALYLNGCEAYVTPPYSDVVAPCDDDAGSPEASPSDVDAGTDATTPPDAGVDSGPDSGFCSYCKGPVAIVGGGDVECLGVIAWTPCPPPAN